MHALKFQVRCIHYIHKGLGYDGDQYKYVHNKTLFK